MLHKQITKLGEDNAELIAQNRQLMERLVAMESRQESIENMLLALSIDLPKEKLVKLNKIK